MKAEEMLPPKTKKTTAVSPETAFSGNLPDQDTLPAFFFVSNETSFLINKRSFKLLLNKKTKRITKVRCKQPLLQLNHNEKNQTEILLTP